MKILKSKSKKAAAPKHNAPKQAAAKQVAPKHERRVSARTKMIHGTSKSPKWDYSHHVIPPITSSATFRLSSSQRGAQGFFEFACDRIDTTRHVPIYIYDRLDEITVQ